MEKKTFMVPNIGCDNCIRTIKSEVGQLAGIKHVEGSVSTKMVTVEWDSPATWPQIVKALTDIEYAPAEA
jgi:copper chaperone CopZ